MLQARRDGPDRLLPERARPRPRHARNHRGRPNQARSDRRRRGPRPQSDRSTARTRRIPRRMREPAPTSSRSRSSAVGPSRPRLLLMLAAAAIVLLIACANVANLQLARGASRGARDVGPRGTRRRPRRGWRSSCSRRASYCRSLGGVLGIALAFGLTKVLVTLIGPQLPVDQTTVTVDGPRHRVRARRFDRLRSVVRHRARHGRRRAPISPTCFARESARGSAHVSTRNALVVVQLALSLSLLASAGLLTRSMMALQRVDPGFAGDHLLTAQFRFTRRSTTRRTRSGRCSIAPSRELRSLPGVEAAALVRASPLSGNGETYPAAIEGRTFASVADAPQVQTNSVTTGYFATMRIPMLVGRDVAETDRAGAPLVVVVNKAFAEQTWPGESADRQADQAGRRRLAARSSAWPATRVTSPWTSISSFRRTSLTRSARRSSRASSFARRAIRTTP